MDPDDTDRMDTIPADRMDTIPAPPPSHVETVGFLRRTIELDDSGIFSFALDCESLDED